MDLSKEAVGRRLKQARIERGYESAADAARAFGWVEGTVRSNENGQRMPSRKALRRYAKAFEVDFEYLETGVRTTLKRLDDLELTVIEALANMTDDQREAFAKMAVATAARKSKAG